MHADDDEAFGVCSDASAKRDTRGKEREREKAKVNKDTTAEIHRQAKVGTQNWAAAI